MEHLSKLFKIKDDSIFDFSSLPKDCKLAIFIFLDRKGLSSSIIVCREWNDLINNNPIIFKSMCQRLWEIKIPHGKVKSWKLEYKSIGILYKMYQLF